MSKLSTKRQSKSKSDSTSGTTEWFSSDSFQRRAAILKILNLLCLEDLVRGFGYLGSISTIWTLWGVVIYHSSAGNASQSQPNKARISTSSSRTKKKWQSSSSFWLFLCKLSVAKEILQRIILTKSSRRKQSQPSNKSSFRWSATNRLTKIDLWRSSECICRCLRGLVC